MRQGGRTDFAAYYDGFSQRNNLEQCAPRKQRAIATVDLGVIRTACAASGYQCGGDPTSFPLARAESHSRKSFARRLS